MLSLLDQATSVGGLDNGDGTFTVGCAPPERYAIGVPLESGMYVKSVTLDGKDVTNEPLDLTSAADKALDIVLSSKASDIHGVVRDTSGKPRSSVQVTIWSAEGDYNLTTASDLGGAFAIGNVPPGDYRIAA
jgi:hypothetical protein